MLRNTGRACALALMFASLTYGAERLEAQDAFRYSQSDRQQSESRDVSYQTPIQVVPGQTGTTVNLRVQEVVNRFNGIDLRHRSYNGGLVGPTIRVNPGQVLRVPLQNRLPFLVSHDAEVHGLNETNLHTHGLHVSPQSPGDDVFLSLLPGQDTYYQFSIPADHPPGTHWYHAHRHGATALQLASGMAGALIVNGGLDQIPAIRNMEEKVMVFQQFSYREVPGEPAYVDPDQLLSEEAELIGAVNGVVTPTVTMRPGEIQRWRIIHAGTELMMLDLEGVNFYEIAVDGLATGQLLPRNRLRLYPGYRVDVLVQAPNRSTTRMMTSEIADPRLALRQKTMTRRHLLRLVIDGDPIAMDWPTDSELAQCVAFTQEDVPVDDEITTYREITFSADGNPAEYRINGLEFDPETPWQQIPLGSCEQWTLKSTGGVHPFHIHVNPFAARGLDSDDPWVWRDTVVVDARNPVVLRTRFLDFPGKTVFHCHNLVHEDRGMMLAFEITETDADTEANRSRRKAPRWTATTVEGRTFSDSELQGTQLVVLHRGMECVHCAEQLRLLSEEQAWFQQQGIQMVAISPFVPEDEAAHTILRQFGFPVLVDSERQVFRKFDCIGSEGVPIHGLFLVGSDGDILWERKTETAITDIPFLISEFMDTLGKTK